MKIRQLHTSENSQIGDLAARYAADHDAFALTNRPLFEAIEAAITRTDSMGRLPLWEAYGDVPDYGRRIDAHTKRRMGDVRTKAQYCVFYAWLVHFLTPRAVLEFGAAFGASGMYWLAGLRAVPRGMLYSFEPNEIWEPIARANFDSVSAQHLLTCGTFEDNIAVIERPVNIALIDAIHTRDFVDAQFAQVRDIAAPGALVLFDDINFSDSMKACWRAISRADGFASVWQLGGRVGVVELM